MVAQEGGVEPAYGDAGDADAVDGPEPDAAHGAFEVDVEGGVDEERDAEEAEEGKDGFPVGVGGATGSPISAEDGDAPNRGDREPEEETGDAAAGEEGDVG